MAIMTRKENDCRGCAECKGCGRDRLVDMEYLECDCCHNQCDILYVYDGEQLCEECLFEKIEKIEL